MRSRLFLLIPLIPALWQGTLAAQEMPFTIQLTSALSTASNHKGDPVMGQVIQPPAFAGDTVSGHITELKQGNKIRGEAVLNFNFDTLQHGGASIPINSSITSIMNSRGQTEVDEEGRVIRRTSNVGKAAVATGAGALIGGLAGGYRGAAIGAGVGAVGSLIVIEVAASGPEVRFAPGAQIGLSVKSRGGPELASLQPNAAGAGGPPPAYSAPAGQPVSSTAPPAAGPGTGDQPQFSTVRIDFVPGERTVFYDDFSDMAQDEPPPHWKVRGNPVELRVAGPIRELYAKAQMNMTSPSFAGPKDFTFELEWTGQGQTDWTFKDKDDHDLIDVMVRGEPDGKTANASVGAPGQGKLGDGGIETDLTQPVHFALWSQRGRVRIYLNGQRLVDVNQVDIAPVDHIYASIGGYRPNGIRKVRVAESAPDFSTMINSSGRYITHGILFDNDSARLKPESAAVLKLVAQGLEKNPALKLEIDGFTDAVGDAGHNLDLSRRRGEAVKTVLISQFGVDAGRLTSSGFGADKPVASNDTPDGRAQNRRVEFVKQ